MIHSTAEVHTQHIGVHTSIWQYCIILSGARIGKNCNINSYVFVESDVIVGDDVTIKSGVQLWDGVRLQDKVFIGPNVTFTNDLFPRSKQYPDYYLKTFVRQGASIGANATIIAGIDIGSYAMIGAGSVVTKSIPKFTLWCGNPAVFIGYVCECGKKLNDKLVCSDCDREYLHDKDSISQK